MQLCILYYHSEFLYNSIKICNIARVIKNCTIISLKKNKLAGNGGGHCKVRTFTTCNRSGDSLKIINCTITRQFTIIVKYLYTSTDLSVGGR